MKATSLYLKVRHYTKTIVGLYYIKLYIYMSATYPLQQIYATRIYLINNIRT